MAEANNLPTVYEFDKNIEDAEAPAPLPPGTYKGVIRSVNPQPSKKDPSEVNAVVTFNISPDQYPVEFSEGDPDGTQLRLYVSLARKPMNMYLLKQFIQAINAPTGRSIDITSWLGCEAHVKVEHEDYEGRTMARIARNGITPA